MNLHSHALALDQRIALPARGARRASVPHGTVLVIEVAVEADAILDRGAIDIDPRTRIRIEHPVAEEPRRHAVLAATMNGHDLKRRVWHGVERSSDPGQAETVLEAATTRFTSRLLELTSRACDPAPGPRLRRAVAPGREGPSDDERIETTMHLDAEIRVTHTASTMVAQATTRVGGDTRPDTAKLRRMLAHVRPGIFGKRAAGDDGRDTETLEEAALEVFIAYTAHRAASNLQARADAVLRPLESWRSWLAGIMADRRRRP